MEIRKLIAPALAVVLLAAVAGGVWYSNQRVRDDTTAGNAARIEQARHVALRGLIGSEKESFFADERVQQALAAQGITVTVEKAGSRTIAERYDAGKFDFGFPSGAPAAQRLKELAKAPNVYNPFYTPIVLASWRPIAEILIANGVAEKQGDFYYVVDLPRLMAMIEKGTRWKELKASAAFSTSKSLLINSTDVRTSNSAAMYLALASYLANGQQIVQSQQDVDRVLPTVAPLFLRQGFQEQSSAGPFEDYLALGMGKAPLLVAYESQLVEFWLKHPDRLRGDMVLLYPRPTVYSKHVLVPYTPGGARLGAALENDPKLRELAHEYGFRTGGEAKGPENWAGRGVKVPDVLVDVIDPPSFEWLERMTTAIEGRFK
ncbi:substrate-binding domain-containing protein [Variovorax paradoxus]|uniref:substrate-binding domain-containing protein n=1 Tax=Variovorax paradoxus TaxID=34073 RepID=UPI001ABC988D